MTTTETRLEIIRRRAFSAWMQLGALLHKLTSPIVLFVLFFLVFTPYALLVRIFRRHPNFDPRLRSSYWEQRDEKGQPDRNFQRQF